MRTTPLATDLPPSPDEERHSRMIRYSIAMLVRFVCIGLCLVVPGWWMVIPAIGAVALPYFAVVLANAAGSSSRKSRAVERPGGIVPYRDLRDDDRLR